MLFKYHENEYQVIFKNENSGEFFAYWCQLEKDSEFDNDHYVNIDGQEYMIGYHDTEECEFDHMQDIEFKDVPKYVFVALMFAMSPEFDLEVERARLK